MRRELLVSFLLVAAVAAVYWPVHSYPFVLLDDYGYVVENPYVRKGLTREGLVHAFTGITVGNWHPLTMLSHMLDCQLFGVEERGGLAPRGQPRAARGQHGPALHRAAADDGGPLAKRLGGGAFRIASLARRIGGLGLGTQGRAQHAVLHAHPPGLSPLCPAADDPPLRGGVRVAGLGADVQTDVGDRAARAACSWTTGRWAAWRGYALTAPREDLLTRSVRSTKLRLLSEDSTADADDVATAEDEPPRPGGTGCPDESGTPRILPISGMADPDEVADEEAAQPPADESGKLPLSHLIVEKIPLLVLVAAQRCDYLSRSAA